MEIGREVQQPKTCKSRDEDNTQTYTSPTRRNASQQPQAFSLLPDPVTLATDGAPLFIDQLLDQHPGAGSLKDEHPILKQSGQYGTPTHAEIPDLVDGKMPMCGLVAVSSSSLAFWSDDMISSLSKRIGNNRLRELVDVIESKMQERISAQGALPPGKIAFKKPTTSAVVPHDVAREYVDAYFEHIHPVYPFLDQTEFEKKAFDSRLPQLWAVNPSFSALYHAVLALGCQYRGGGSFDPGKGKAWDLFQVSLGLMADILVPRESLLNLQALVAMSIFATNMCCLQIDEVLLMEATRMALSLRYHKSSNRTADLADQTTCHRTFWVIYAMEKQVCFRNHNTSLIADCDIGCPIPKSSDSTFGDYDWFFASIRFGRILSQAYTSLFSVSGSLSTRSHHHAVMDHIQGLMEVWRMSIPEDFRPGTVRMNHNIVGPSARMVFLQTSYNYYALVIALARLRLHIEANEPGQEASLEENKKTLMNAAQMILELTRYIDTDAYSPIL
ncbi:Transcription factor domain [Ilyonectria robusta]